jgi:hypothetical protein
LVVLFLPVLVPPAVALAALGLLVLEQDRRLIAARDPSGRQPPRTPSCARWLMPSHRPGAHCARAATFLGRHCCVSMP